LGTESSLCSKALEALKIDAKSEDPSGGRIDRIPNSTEPSGILREHASAIAEHAIESSWSVENRLDFLRRSIRECVDNGITAVQTNDRDCWKLYKILHDSGELPIRIYLTINYDETCKKNSDDSKDYSEIPRPGEAYGHVNSRFKNLEPLTVLLISCCHAIG
jgi:predicted amidohydrolase YtcJ